MKPIKLLALVAATTLSAPADPDAADKAKPAMIGDIPIEHYWGGMWLHNSKGKRSIHLSPSDRRTAYEGLLRFLREDEDAGIRASAARWLGSLKEHAALALPQLGESLEDENEDVRSGALKAILKITHRLSEKEKEFADLKGWHETPEAMNRACRICLKNRLTMGGILDHFGASMRIEIQKNTMEFFYAPSQVLTLTFDGGGRVVRCQTLDGLDLDRESVLESKAIRKADAEPETQQPPLAALSETSPVS